MYAVLCLFARVFLNVHTVSQKVLRFVMGLSSVGIYSTVLEQPYCTDELYPSGRKFCCTRGVELFTTVFIEEH